MIEAEEEVSAASRTQASEPGDHDRMAHYVHKDDMLEGMVNGWPVMALCGKIWIPTRDGEKFPICGTCAELIKTLPPKE